MRKFVLLFRCRDRKGIIARISDFIFKNGGNIVTADQHSTDPQGGYFFIRVEFVMEEEGFGLRGLVEAFDPVGREFEADWKIYDCAESLRMGVLVSRPDHCLEEILYLWNAGELKVKIPFVLSNCEKHRKLVTGYGIPFYYLPADKDNRRENEILSYASGATDFLVLARYMLVLSPEFLVSYNKDIINIHHGFLPSFKGTDPYGQALEKGVKVIGSTVHFVNNLLDEGPIIAQEVEHVSHRDSRQDLIAKGRHSEKKALDYALSKYIDHRIIRYENKTIVF
ncbi:MAG: formyltetrahydrofolate deformylase [Candidatus Omnitrophica bacterium]|jgi:formyltetrahydrofolate deformylase|nr:formyltetrahydrofolate deformylase [Candidatus Omnitrophota bacterium]MDD3274973.1 formyltetrahydrofolate deformylase [Candidatus Omnitrophota bacterium]MDD5077621.1 formyltetrahydrofolate deformylase [Candidatus Omnitrophota bacterium]MDD5724787.1 formyltetrahydrofolate deformylase [Candidatus Omnitrophota bacterium]